MAFDSYARCYDLLYRDKNYPAEAAFVHQQLQRHGPGARRVLDLGCGTGAHAVPLVELGYEVHGVDLSPGMVAQAELRRQALPASQAARLHFEQGDMRNVRLDGSFDAAVSLFHVMTYQTLDEDLAAVLAGVARHLQPGGVFLFDFWYGPGVMADPPAVRVKRVEDDALRVTRVAEPALHHERNAVDIHYHLFAEDKHSGAIEQIRETHHMRYWFWPELQRHIEAVGLQALGLWEWMGESPARADSWLAYAVCRRPDPERGA